MIILTPPSPHTTHTAHTHTHTHTQVLQYWPEEVGDMVTYGTIVVQVVETTAEHLYTCRKIKLANTKVVRTPSRRVCVCVGGPMRGCLCVGGVGGAFSFFARLYFRMFHSIPTLTLSRREYLTRWSSSTSLAGLHSMCRGCQTL